MLKTSEMRLTMPLITPAVDLGIKPMQFQCNVRGILPSRPLFIGFRLLVPVGGRYRTTFILAFCGIILLVSILVKDVILFLFTAPCTVFIYRTHCEHNVRVSIPVSCVMYAKVGTHLGADKFFFHISVSKGDILFHRQLNRQGDV